MRQFVLMIALMLPASVMAEGPSFLNQIHACVETSVKYAEYATLANSSKESDKGAFIAFVQQEADIQQNINVKQLLIRLGTLAWLGRGRDVHSDAMQLYEDCYSKLGFKI